MKNTRISLTLQQMQHLAKLEPMLAKVLEDLLDVWPNKSMVVTSIYRTDEEDKALGGSGVHACTPHRALDIRVKNLGAGFQAIADEVADVINSIYHYDPDRPNLRVAISKPHGSGAHLHVQVHPRTKRNLLQ